jgi:hypothetical protein
VPGPCPTDTVPPPPPPRPNTHIHAQANWNNSVVAFKDNSSAIRGTRVHPLLPRHPGGPSALAPTERDWDLLLTAETHNFPCAVAPYPGGCCKGWWGWQGEGGGGRGTLPGWVLEGLVGVAGDGGGLGWEGGGQAAAAAGGQQQCAS